MTVSDLALATWRRPHSSHRSILQERAWKASSKYALKTGVRVSHVHVSLMLGIVNAP